MQIPQVFMAKIKYTPFIQLEKMADIVAKGVLINYSYKREIRGGYSFNFSLSNQKIGGESVDVIFRHYHLNIIYLHTDAPKIYIRIPSLHENTPHLYKDSSLCLYHPSEFVWDDTKSIAQDLIPWVYMWVFYYERWLEFGEWFGKEFKH